jgi:hypothetical protein
LPTIAKVTPERACFTETFHAPDAGFDQLEPLLARAPWRDVGLSGVRRARRGFVRGLGGLELDTSPGRR